MAEYINLSTGSVTTSSGGQSSTEPGTSAWQLAAELDALLVVTPWSHFGFTVGPVADLPIAGKSKTQNPGTPATGPTVGVNNASMLQVGLTGGLLGYF